MGRRWNQDPKPNPSISNYAAFANNPIWNTDVLGDTAFRFNSKGIFMGIINDGKEDWSIQLEKKSSTDIRKGIVITTYSIHSFNDPEIDVPNMKKLVDTYGKTATLLYKKTESDIHKYMDESGSTLSEDNSFFTRWGKAWNENYAKYDFWAGYLANESLEGGISEEDVYRDRGAFYIFEGNKNAYNAMDAGNFLFGGAMKNSGFSRFAAKMGGHANQFKRGEEGSGVLDAPGDQSAIEEGHDSIKIYPKK